MSEDSSFKSKLSELSGHLGRLGVEKEIHAETPQFDLLDVERRNQALLNVGRQALFMEFMTPSLSESELLTYTCEFFALKSKETSYFDMLTPEHCIEIVDLNFNQLFRNRRIYEMSGYSLEEFECYPPFELFDRPAGIIPLLKEKTDQLVKTRAGLELGDLPNYLLREKLKPHTKCFMMKHDFIWPLFNKVDEVAAFVSVFRVEELDATTMNKVVML